MGFGPETIRVGVTLLSDVSCFTVNGVPAWITAFVANSLTTSWAS